MKIASVQYGDQKDIAIVTNRGIFRGTSLANKMGTSLRWKTLQALLSAGERAQAILQEWGQHAVAAGWAPDPEPTRWLAPVPDARTVICVGLNYRPHAVESGLEIPTHPVLFNKYANALVGHGATVYPPYDAQHLDYEAELVLIMGSTCAQVTEAEALDYVFGYCNGNDLSARDLQFRTSQWLLGKTCDGFGPMGPYVVTRDEVADPQDLSICGRRNGVIVQSANTREMIFSCAEVIAYVSRYITLEPGDVLFTGTPEGVIFGYPEAEQRWLQSGERLSVEIEGLGTLVTDIGDSGRRP